MANASGIEARPAVVERLRGALKGSVITDGDEGYDQARSTFYAGTDHRPLLIARVTNRDDVRRVVAAAREEGLPLSVRGGGHGMAGFSVADKGIVLDLSGMKNLQVDEGGRTVWADAGLTAGEVTAAVDEHGLVIGFGDTASVGVGGLTLGGGMGYLVRKHGLTIDNLQAAEVVTADGQLLYTDAKSHPDLFWAIRGGGGNFGVATRFQYRLHRLGEILGGLLILPATPSTIEDFVSLAQAAPDELSAIVNIMAAPPLPFLPPEVHGKRVMFATLVYAGDVQAGAEAVAPFRRLAKPLVDQVRPLRYPQLFPRNEGNRSLVAVRTRFADQVGRAQAGLILDRLGRSTGSFAVTQLRVLGGAMASVDPAATAFAHRGARIMANVLTVYNRPEEKPVHEAWASEFSGALGPDGAGAFVNFMGDEGEARVREAYPAGTWERLASIKRRYDPTNLFRLNVNVPPTPFGSGGA